MAEFKPQWFGDYELVKPLGQGGMAEVFIARTSRAEGFEKVVVVKRMLPDLTRNKKFVDMFLSEARLAVQLRHGNIVQILALELHEGQPFIVMEYVHGKDLRQLLKKAKQDANPLPIDFGIHCLAEMLAGLGAAHQATGSDGKPLNLVHRDVTPANIFLSYDGDVKLGDFGVALTGAELQAAELRGKLTYLAPEALDNQPLDRRSDLFSAGIVLWETLALRSLFKGRNDGEILMQVKTRVPEPPSVHNSQVPKELDAITAKALAKRPDDRYQSAHEFEDALTEWLYANRSRWSRRRLADELRQRYPEESKPLRLPPPSLPPVMGALVEPEATPSLPPDELPPDELPPDEQPPAGLPPDAVAPGMVANTPNENPWPESIESLGDEIDETSLELQRVPVEFQQTERLMVYATGAAGPVSMSMNQLLPLLATQPQSVLGLGVVGDWRLRREDLAGLLYWDSLVAPPQLPAQSATEGYFSHYSLTRMIYELSTRHHTGVLLLEQVRGAGYRIICFEAGVPVYVVSNRPQDGAPVLIHEKQLLANELLYCSIVEVISDRIPLDQALLKSAGPANQPAIERTFSALMRSRLYEAFYWTDGRFRIYSECGMLLRLTTRVSPLTGMLVRAVRRAASPDELESALYMKGLRRIELTRPGHEIAALLRLKSEEKAVVAAIDGRSGVGPLMARLHCTAGEQEHMIQSVLYVLHETRLAHFS